MRHPDYDDTRRFSFKSPAEEDLIDASISAITSAITAVIIICMIIAVYVAAQPGPQRSAMPTFKHLAGE